MLKHPGISEAFVGVSVPVHIGVTDVFTGISIVYLWLGTDRREKR